MVAIYRHSHPSRVNCAHRLQLPDNKEMPANGGSPQPLVGAPERTECVIAARTLTTAAPAGANVGLQGRSP
jgi:hypothetical protein